MLARIPDRSTAAFVACVLKRANLLSESRLASVSEQELMEIGISQTDAGFLKLDEADWDGLDQLCRALQACHAESQLCGVCEGCRVRFAVYAHGLHSVQALLSNIDRVQMIPLGTRSLLRNRQQQALHRSGELEAAAPNCGAARGQAVDDVLRLDCFVNPAGNSFCVSCNNEILDESLTCLGCPAHCHFACWRKARHSDWRELVFVCLLCRAQKPDLNNRVRLPERIKSPLPAQEQRCLDCGADPRSEECVICCLCGGSFCADTCAMLGLRAAYGTFRAPDGWTCRYCFGLEPYDELVCSHLDTLMEPAMEKARDQECTVNFEAMIFFQIMFAASEQQAQRILDRHSKNLEQLLLLDKRKAEMNPKYMMAIEPMQLLSFYYPWLTEQLAYVCSDSHARHFYDNARGSSKEFRDPSSTEVQQRRRKIGILTSDWGPHPTKEMLDCPLQELNTNNFELCFFLLVSFPMELKELKSRYGNSNVILLTKTTMSDLKKAEKILSEQLDALIFLDGHTNKGRGVFGELEKIVCVQNLRLKLLVWCAFPGVYGGRVSRTIVCPETAKDKVVYGQSKTAEMQCYHVRSPPAGATSREQMLDSAASRGISRKNCGIPDTALVLGYPGRLGRFSIATQKAFAALSSENAAIHLYFVVHATSAFTVLNVYRSLLKLGVEAHRMLFTQALPAELNNVRLAVNLDAVGDTKDGYGLHSTASALVCLGVPVVTLQDTRFHNNPAAAILKAARLGMLCAEDDDNYLEILRKLLFDKEFSDTVKSALNPAALEQIPVFNSTRAAAMLAELLHLSFESDIQHISSVQGGRGSDVGNAVLAEKDTGRLLELTRLDSRWKNKLDQDASLQGRVQMFEKCCQDIAPSVKFDSILKLGENLGTVVIAGSASMGKGTFLKRIQVVIKAHSDRSTIEREHAAMTDKRICRNEGNCCVPRIHPIFANSRNQFAGLQTRGGWTWMAMEPLDPYLEQLIEPACREFRDHGRILDKWQHVFYKLFDAILFLQGAKLRHGKLSLQHVMRHPDSGRIIFTGYDGATFYSDEDQSKQLMPAQGSDIFSAGMMLLEPLLDLKPVGDSAARRARELVISRAFEDGDFRSFVGCVRRLLPPSVRPIVRNSGQEMLERITQDPECQESDPVMQIRRDRVSGLLKLVFQCCTNPCKDCAMQALLGGFLVDYIPVSAEKERILVLEGMRVTGRFEDSKSRKLLKDSLVLLVPDQGLQVVALLDTASIAPLGYYGGVYGPPAQNHHSWSAARCRLHTLPADTLAIDGCPSGPQLFLEDLLEISAPGSLFASSRFNPSETNLYSGNVAVPARNLPLTRLAVRDLDVRGVMMYSSKFIVRGSVYAWPYNWARVAGLNAYSMEEIQRRQMSFQSGLPKYTLEIILQQRKFAILAGGFDDPAEPS